ncbi:glycosyltransferase [Candidatus Pelagibacter sp.]|nr:glycosyltransferase [Candidatus Pelagibacter sp.]
MSNFQLSIIIPTWNRKKKLIKLLKTIISKIKNKKIKYEIIICDSFSTDGTQIEIFKKLCSNKNIVYKNIKKNNIAAKRNIGIKSSKYSNILLLDDDCLPMADFFKILKDELKLKKDDTIYCGQYFTPEKLINTSNYYKFRDEKNLKISTSKKITNKNIITGCCFFNKKNIYKKIMFDESIQGYGLEDVEWAYRLSQRKFKIFLTKARVNHQETSQNIQAYVQKWFILSRDSMPTILKKNKLMILPRNIQLFEVIFKNSVANIFIRFLIFFIAIPMSLFLKKYLFLVDSKKIFFSRNLFSLILKLYYFRGAVNRKKFNQSIWYNSGYK